MIEGVTSSTGSSEIRGRIQIQWRRRAIERSKWANGLEVIAGHDAVLLGCPITSTNMAALVLFFSWIVHQVDEVFALRRGQSHWHIYNLLVHERHRIFRSPQQKILLLWLKSIKGITSFDTYNFSEGFSKNLNLENCKAKRKIVEDDLRLSIPFYF